MTGEEAEARSRLLDESWQRWEGRLPRRILTVLLGYELTVEQAAAMTDSELLKLHKLGRCGVGEFRRATRKFGG